MARIRQIQTFRRVVETIVPNPDPKDESDQDSVCKWTAEFRVLSKDAERDIQRKRQRVLQKLTTARKDGKSADEIEQLQDEVGELSQATIDRILVSVPTDEKTRHRLEVEACAEDGTPIYDGDEVRLLQGEELRQWVMDSPMFAQSAVNTYNEATRGMPAKN